MGGYMMERQGYVWIIMELLFEAWMSNIMRIFVRKEKNSNGFTKKINKSDFVHILPVNLMAISTFGYTLYQSISRLPNTLFSIWAKLWKILNSGPELSTRLIAMLKISLKMGQMCSILNMFTVKSSPKSTLSKCYGLPNGEEVMTQMLKKYLSTMLSMLENSSRWSTRN